MSDKPTTTCIAPWFGSARMMAPAIGALLKGLRWIGIPFCGGLPEVLEMDARTIVCNDVHRHVINLARVMADPQHGPALYRRLRRLPFCDDMLVESQGFCKCFKTRPEIDGIDTDAAFHYFVACWMGRSGMAGIGDEFTGRISVRWNANGGDSNTRYRSAVKSLSAWRRILQRCNFTCMDCFDFLERCEDKPGHAIYADPPWIDDGDRYKHQFSLEDHEKLAERLVVFRNSRIVVRLGIGPEVERLYPRDRWQWHIYEGRTQGNNSKAEVLLVRNGEQRLF